MQRVLRTTDPVQYILLSVRTAWNRVAVGFVFWLARVFAVGRHAAPYGLSDGRIERIGRAFGAGLNGLIPMAVPLREDRFVLLLAHAWPYAGILSVGRLCRALLCYVLPYFALLYPALLCFATLCYDLLSFALI